MPAFTDFILTLHVSHLSFETPKDHRIHKIEMQKVEIVFLLPSEFTTPHTHHIKCDIILGRLQPRLPSLELH